MMFGRREKRPALLTFERILVPMAGTEADEGALRLTAVLLALTGHLGGFLSGVNLPG